MAILNLKQGDATTDAPARASIATSPPRASTCSTTTLDERPGAKFATADLIGIPWQVLVGPKGLAEGKVEVKKRADGSRREPESRRPRSTC